ncbi:MAG: hypothetical protein LWW94_06790 [Candidatus Desulfofervidaceae bacterium]|nr:hypothetical protein [Candidatus Desulfofervidaceae bacterium]
MADSLERQLMELKLALISMASEVEKHLNEILEVFSSRNLALAQWSLSAGEIDIQKVNLNRKCYFLLSCYQPLVRDLRFIVATIHISHILSHIENEIMDIAKQAALLTTKPIFPSYPNDLLIMGRTVNKMIKKVIDAFVNEDVELALEAQEQNKKIDDLHGKVIRTLLDFIILQGTPAIEQKTYLILIAHSLRQIGSLGTAIAEQILSFVEGSIWEASQEITERRGNPR